MAGYGLEWRATGWSGGLRVGVAGYGWSGGLRVGVAGYGRELGPGAGAAGQVDLAGQGRERRAGWSWREGLGSGRMGGMAGISSGGERTHAGRWTLEDRFASPWHYLPVEVGPGTAGLRVELEYDRGGGAVLDLGCLGPDGFRGWSGGARGSFVITADEATPGYLPGELEAGLWQVMIGVHRIPPDGTGYRVSALTTPVAAGLLPPAPRPRRRRGSARRGGICQASPAGGGWRVTCTRTPCTPTGG